MRLAIQVDGDSEYSLEKINSDTFLDAYELATEGKVFGAASLILKNSIEEKHTTKNIWLVTAEVLLKDIFKNIGAETLLETVMHCPRCSHQIVKEDGEVDSRIDFDGLEVLYSGSDGEEINYVYTFPEPLKLKQRDSGEITVMALKFQPPTLGIMVEIENDATLRDSAKARLKTILLECIVDIDFEYSGESELTAQKLKNIYKTQLVTFDDTKAINLILKNLRRFGFDLLQDEACGSCGKKWKQAVDFTSFFVSGLRSLSSGTEPS